MDKTGQVVFTSFWVSLIVGALALGAAFQYHLGWWICIPATLAAGVVAYVGQDPQSFLTGLAQAYNKTVEYQINWIRLRIASAAGLMCGTVVGYFFALLNLAPIHKGTPASLESEVMILIVTVLGSIVLGTPSVYIFLIFLGDYPTGSDLQSLRLVRWINPICFPIAVVYFPLRGIWRVRMEIADAILSLRDLISYIALETLKSVHSNERRVVMISSTLGTFLGVLLGLTTGQFLIGSLACGALGAGIGFVEYRFVAPRLAHLTAPA